MTQQVNLYRDSLRPQRILLPASWLAGALLGMLVVLAGIYGYLSWRLDQRQAELERVQSREQRLSDQLQELSKKAAEHEPDPELKRKAEQLEDELRVKRELTGVLSGESYGNVEGFSPLLVPLARRHVDGIWLRHIVVRNGGEQLVLGGRVLDASQVPAYLEALREDAVYQGRRFNTFRMQRAPERRGLGFVLATRCPGADEQANIEQAADCLDGGD